MPEQQLQGTSGVVHEKSPRVSIGMPVYNGEKYIREALDSLLVQTFTDFELIISDNASSDDTQAICEEYARRDKRVRYVRQSENIGMVANFQFVLDGAIGEYFMWAAHDDIWSPNWLEELLPLIAKQDVVLAFGASVKTDSNLMHIGRIKTYNINSNSPAIRMLHYFFLDENGKGNPFYGLYKTIFIKSQGIIDVRGIDFGGDFRHIFSLSFIGKIASAPNCLLLKRNTIPGFRRHKYSLPILIGLFFVEFTHVVKPDRMRYLMDFIRIAPMLHQKILIASCLPLKVVQAIVYQYARGIQLGLEILKNKI